MTNHSPVRRWAGTTITGGVVAAVVAAGVVIGGTPAVAAGETSATALRLALDADLQVGPLTTTLASVNSRLGHVSAPSSEGTNRGSVGTLSVTGTAVDGQASVGAVTATHTDIGNRSSAQLVGADVDLLTEGLVTTGYVESSSMCPVGGTPAVQANVVGLQVLGRAVDVGVSPVTVRADAALAVPGVADATIVATVSSPRSVGSSSAAVTAVHVDAKVVVNALGGGDDVTVDLGYVDLGTSRCATPAAVKPNTSTINPNQGPTSGGQTVRITGDAFVPGNTSVSFGATTVPASRVDVASDGDSLTVKTPAHAAGPVQVVVRTPGGADGPLGYTYVAGGGGGTGPGDGDGGEGGGGDDGDNGSNGGSGSNGSGSGGTNGNGTGDSGSVTPVSQITGTGSTPDSIGGLLAQTGPLGLVGMTLLALVLILGGAMLAKRASERPGLAENPWVDPEE